MASKRKAPKPTKRHKSKQLSKPARKQLAKANDNLSAPVLSWIGDMIVGGPFDHSMPSAAKSRSIRRTFAEAASGKSGALEKLREAVVQQGDKLSMDAAESELGSLVRYWAQFKADSWRALLPLVASDEHYHAAMASRALMMSHPEGVLAGAKEVVAVIDRRFDFMNLADQSDVGLKQLAAATILRGILLMGDIQLAGVAKHIARHLTRDLVAAAVATEDGDGREEFDMPPSLLIVEFILGCAEKEEPGTDAYLEWLVYLASMPKAHKGKPCLEIYEYPRGRITPIVSFISYPDWVAQNQSRIRNISYREAGRHDDSSAGYLFSLWPLVKRTKPSYKQLALQGLLEKAEDIAFRAGKAPPLNW